MSSDVVLDADVVVVGSGAGGAVVAAHLAEAGHRVVILEEGPWVKPEVYGTMRPSEAIRHLWRESAMSFAVGVGDTPMINVMMGRCVGGSSVLTGGVCFRTPGHVVHEWQHARGLHELSERSLEPCFDDVERAVHVEEVPESLRSQSTVLFGKGLERSVGVSLVPLRRNTTGCQGKSRCNFGCPHGAKLSVDRVYLPRALAKGAQIFAGCLISKVTSKGGRASGVVGKRIEGPERRVVGRVEVKAKTVVIAAGAWHSPLILQASGVGRWKDQVGRHLTVHPAFRVMGAFEQRIDGWKGALQSAYSPRFEAEGMILTSLFVPPGVLAATMPGIGRVHRNKAALIPHLGVFGGTIHDDGGGTVRRAFGREPLVTYRMTPKDRSLIAPMLTRMAEIWFAAGAREVFLPVLGSEGVRSMDEVRAMNLEALHGSKFESGSQHPLGSTRMGNSADSSVVDSDGQAWDLPGLFCADGGVIPTSLGVNPQLTIMAMATRIAWRLRDRLERRGIAVPARAS
jgi:choline dehydrogenase-like flavoprotein